MLIKVNENWAVNVKNIKDIGISGSDRDLVVITWLDDSTNSYKADNAREAKKWFDRLVAKCENLIDRATEVR